MRFLITATVFFLLSQAVPLFCAGTPPDSYPGQPLLWLEPGSRVLENDGSQCLTVHLRQKGSAGIEQPDFESIRVRLFDIETQQTLPATFHYRSGHPEARISSRQSKRLFLETWQTMHCNGKTFFSGCGTTVSLRAYSRSPLHALSQPENPLANRGVMPLTVRTAGYYYWPKVGDTIAVAVAYNGEPMAGHQLFVDAPGDIRKSYATDHFGLASFNIPAIDDRRFASRFDGLPVIIWTHYTDPETRMNHVTSMTIEAHPGFYTGDHYQDARVLVLGLMAAFTVIFSIHRIHNKRYENH